MVSDLTIDPIYHAVLESYYRCEESDGFWDTFYRIFFAKSPEIPPKFADTDMERQKQIIGASLLWMLRLGRGAGSGEDRPIAQPPGPRHPTAIVQPVA